MPNHYFQFKQFTVQQEQCAMKVSTDACLFGAWVAAKIAADTTVENTVCVLDIGSGTGLLSLMLAQQVNAFISAIEIDADAAGQTTANFQASSWKDRLEVLWGDATNFSFPRQYDFIISNPPFFENDLRSADSGKNKAKHDESLRFDALLSIIHRQLKPGGRYGLLLPFHRTNYVEQLVLAKGHHLLERCLVKQTPAHPYFRTMLYCTNTTSSAIQNTSTITIKEDQNTYSPSFTDLLKGYYLYIV
jgi:tRNA1Val (adenine37-N6)-methyltransferase